MPADRAFAPFVPKEDHPMHRKLVIVGALSALVFAGCGKKQVEAPPPPVDITSPPTGIPPPLPGGPPGVPATLADGRAIFMANCAKCHGENGKGKLKGQPDFTDAAWQRKVSREEIVETIRDGHEEMPSFRDKLMEPQIETVAAYVQSLSAPAPGA